MTQLITCKVCLHQFPPESWKNHICEFKRPIMTRDQLMKDFEETFTVWFDNSIFDRTKHITTDGRIIYKNPETQQAYTIWVSAFETYSTDRIIG